MKPEIHTVFDPETNASSVLVNGVEYMRVNADLTIEGFGGMIGDIMHSETYPLRTREYMDWVQGEAGKIPALPLS